MAPNNSAYKRRMEKMQAEQARNMSGQNAKTVEAGAKAAGGNMAFESAKKEMTEAEKEKERKRLLALAKAQKKSYVGGGAFVGAQNIDKTLVGLK